MTVEVSKDTPVWELKLALQVRGNTLGVLGGMGHRRVKGRGSA